MPDEPRQPPTSRIARSARLGGLVAGQSARWVGTRAANVVRTPERADEATGERAAALARELVEQLGQMRGAAMKVGQVLSTIDFAALPEDERENFKQTLAQLRDDVPPLPFKRLEKLLREELGEKPSDDLRRVRGGGVRGRLDRPGAPRRDARGQGGRGQGPVPRRRRGGRDRPAQPLAAAAARAAARARPGRQGALRRAARADRGGARLRARGPAPARGLPRAPRPPVRLRPRGLHASSPAGACWSRS